MRACGQRLDLGEQVAVLGWSSWQRTDDEECSAERNAAAWKGLGHPTNVPPASRRVPASIARLETTGADRDFLATPPRGFGRRTRGMDALVAPGNCGASGQGNRATCCAGHGHAVAPTAHERPESSGTLARGTRITRRLCSRPDRAHGRVGCVFSRTGDHDCRRRKTSARVGRASLAGKASAFSWCSRVWQARRDVALPLAQEHEVATGLPALG
jgi:hypothetical protein